MYKRQVFDLTSTEAFLPQTKEVDEEGKPRRKRPVPMYPSDWRDSFGMPVLAHTASTRVDLMEGFDLMENAAGAQTPEQMPMEIIDQETGEVTKV